MNTGVKQNSMRTFNISGMLIVLFSAYFALYTFHIFGIFLVLFSVYFALHTFSNSHIQSELHQVPVLKFQIFVIGKGPFLCLLR